MHLTIMMLNIFCGLFNFMGVNGVASVLVPGPWKEIKLDDAVNEPTVPLVLLVSGYDDLKRENRRDYELKYQFIGENKHT